MRIIGRFWKHYRACLQALKKGIIGKKKRIIYLGLTQTQAQSSLNIHDCFYEICCFYCHCLFRINIDAFGLCHSYCLVNIKLRSGASARASCMCIHNSVNFVQTYYSYNSSFYRLYICTFNHCVTYKHCWDDWLIVTDTNVDRKSTRLNSSHP